VWHCSDAFGAFTAIDVFWPNIFAIKGTSIDEAEPSTKSKQFLQIAAPGTLFIDDVFRS